METVVSGCEAKVPPVNREHLSRSQPFGVREREAAFHAQDIEHHPDWSNNYNEVLVRLTTDDFNGISSLDIRLAKRMEKIAKAKGA